MSFGDHTCAVNQSLPLGGHEGCGPAGAGVAARGAAVVATLGTSASRGAVPLVLREVHFETRVR